MRTGWLWLLVLCLVPAPPAMPQASARGIAQYAIIVTIDGGRPDGLRAANIGPILQDAAYSMTAQTTVPPITAPSHMSMISGVGPERHGVRTNDWRPGSAYPTAPTVFSIAKAAGLRTALFTQKVYVLGIADPRVMDRVELVRYRPATATADLMDAALTYLRSTQPHVALVHIAEPDVVGHELGWMSFGYLQALRRAVEAVGTLRGALRELGLEARTLMIVTADHGGIEKDHVALVPEVLTIPWIALGPGVRKGGAIERRIMTYDTAATVLHALGLAVPADWDGRPVLEAFASRMPSAAAAVRKP